MALTKKQKEVYEYIKTYFQENGYSPTQKEIKDHFELKSFGSVNRYMKYLLDANLIEQDWNARRGIKILEFEKEEESNVIEASSSFETLPLLGDVAAGNPIEAIESTSDFITIPKSMISGAKRHYALSVKGDSMIEDGIHDGDTLICRHEVTAKQGQTVIALLDNEATVKRFYKKKNQYELHPANERLVPIIVEPDQHFQIAGVVVGLIRNYE